MHLRVLRGSMPLILMPKAIVHGHDTRYVRLQKNYCFACGKNNPEGMRLKFTYDEERGSFVCRFRLGQTLHRAAGPRPRRHHCDDSRRGHGQGEQAAPCGRADLADHRELLEAGAAQSDRCAWNRGRCASAAASTSTWRKFSMPKARCWPAAVVCSSPSIPTNVRQVCRSIVIRERNDLVNERNRDFSPIEDLAAAVTFVELRISPSSKCF